MGSASLWCIRSLVVGACAILLLRLTVQLLPATFQSARTTVGHEEAASCGTHSIHLLSPIFTAEVCLRTASGLHTILIIFIRAATSAPVIPRSVDALHGLSPRHAHPTRRQLRFRFGFISGCIYTVVSSRQPPYRGHRKCRGAKVYHEPAGKPVQISTPAPISLHTCASCNYLEWVMDGPPDRIASKIQQCITDFNMESITPARHFVYPSIASVVLPEDA